MGPRNQDFYFFLLHIFRLKENSSMSFYRRNLPHIQRDYKPHFVTFVTKQRAVLSPWAKEIILRCCIFGHATKYNLYVAMVMPDCSTLFSLL